MPTSRPTPRTLPQHKQRRAVIVAIALTVAATAVVACTRPASTDAAHLIVTGSSTVAPLLGEIAKRYEAAHPGVRIDVQTGGSSRGIADARSGNADIGMASRALKPDEADLGAHTIARDGVALIVHADNPVTALSDQQVRDIYTGRSERWRDVGGPDAAVTVVHKAAGRATLEVFLAHFGLDDRDVRPDVVIGDNAQGIKTVAGDPNAVGYVSLGAAELERDHGAAIKLLPANGTRASTAALAAGNYPIARPLNLVTRAAPNAAAAAFIAYAQSPAVHDLIAAQGFVPVHDAPR